MPLYTRDIHLKECFYLLSVAIQSISYQNRCCQCIDFLYSKECSYQNRTSVEMTINSELLPSTITIAIDHHQLKNKNGLKNTSDRGGHFLFNINKVGNLVHSRRGLRIEPLSNLNTMQADFVF